MKYYPDPWRTLPDRLVARLDGIGDPAGCWIWTGSTNANGYGRIRVGKGRAPIYVHRAAWLVLGGRLELPEGMVIHHACGVRRCANPAHLRATTYSQNNLAENRRLDQERLWGGAPAGLFRAI